MEDKSSSSPPPDTLSKSDSKQEENLPVQEENFLLGPFAALVLHVDLLSSTLIVPLLTEYDLTSLQKSVVLLSKPSAEMIANMMMIGSTIADRCGPRPCIVAGMCTIAAGSILFGCVQHFAAFTLARVISGIGASFSVPAVMKLVAAYYQHDHHRRDQTMSFAFTGDALGGVTGPVIGSAGYALTKAAGGSRFLALAVPQLFVTLLCVGLVVLYLTKLSDVDKPVNQTDVLSTSQVLSSRATGAILCSAAAFSMTAMHVGATELSIPKFMKDTYNCGAGCNGFLWAAVGGAFAVVALIWIPLLGKLHGIQVKQPDTDTSGPIAQSDTTQNEAVTESQVTENVVTSEESPPAYSASASPDEERQQLLEKQPDDQAGGTFSAAMIAWLAILVGGAILVVYPLLLAVNPRTQYREERDSRPFAPESIISLVLLGAALALVFVPANVFTQSVTLKILGEGAMARTLGLLQAGKNGGFVTGCLLAHAVVHTSEYNRLWCVLIGLGGAVVLCGLGCKYFTKQLLNS